MELNERLQVPELAEGTGIYRLYYDVYRKFSVWSSNAACRRSCLAVATQEWRNNITIRTQSS
jgi:hypothetical protein